MSAKKLDLGKAVKRELYEPKLKGRQAVRRVIENIDREKVKNAQSFKKRLKSKLDVKNLKLDVENIELGMTPDEIVKVAGRPRYIVEWYTGNMKYNYGKVWVVIENGVVTCLVRAKDFEEYWGRSDYQSINPKAIIK